MCSSTKWQPNKMKRQLRKMTNNNLELWRFLSWELREGKATTATKNSEWKKKPYDYYSFALCDIFLYWNHYTVVSGHMNMLTSCKWVDCLVMCSLKTLWNQYAETHSGGHTMAKRKTEHQRKKKRVKMKIMQLKERNYFTWQKNSSQKRWNVNISRW